MEPQLALDDHGQGKESHRKTSLNIDGVETSSARLGTSPEGRGPKEQINGSHVVNVKVNEEHLREEKICRICHLSNEASSGSSELIQLGCNCRGELEISHRVCAEAWFKQRGNRLCEICNTTAKNVRLIKDTRIYIMEFNEIRPMETTSLDLPRDDGSRRYEGIHI
ncbi:hypothetical protein ACH5RR_028513 [Cinchona calisaya]|uniref:RING-CH-type domain-containing protein n=1 Tax=Cinchona calisaya TaxID=153742 RepID=A0ABD2YP06_9GENT